MKFIIIGYRDAYFWNEYGTSVRDLQIAEIISRQHEVVFVNRPVSIYERLLRKNKKSSIYKKYSDRIKFIDCTSYDLIGPLSGRYWTKKCYTRIVNNILDRCDDDTTVIDFTPLAMLGYKKKANIIYWYDLIDNFAIHNRFTVKEKKAVQEKYKYVDNHADIITAVSDKALSSFTNINKYVMPNGVYIEKETYNHFEINDDVYHFGFVGFVTDKLDVAFLNELSQKYKIIIWGRFFDESIRNKLSGNIKIAGAFKYSDLSEIMKTFQIGLLPYLTEKSHDESPLKMYEYFKYGRPCLSSMHFEISSKWFINYMAVDKDILYDRIEDLLINSNSSEIKATIKDEWMFERKIDLILQKVMLRQYCDKKDN
jgi:hypothetical protein